MNFINNSIDSLKASLPLTIFGVIALLCLFYYFFYLLYRSNAKKLILIFAISIVTMDVITINSNDELSGLLLINFLAVFLLALISLFATEVKKDVWHNSKKKSSEVKHIDKEFTSESAKQCISEIIKALQNMSKNDIGAIIILANNNLPNVVLESGVAINSVVSSALIESIFFPKTPLHDGAMILNQDKIQSAGCFLPLSQENALNRDLGTRHRAGIGITETIEVTSIIVSEETGIISIAEKGNIRRYADTKMLQQVLMEYYWQSESSKK